MQVDVGNLPPSDLTVVRLLPYHGKKNGKERLFRFLLGHVNLLALPQHQHTSFLCPDVSDRIALSFLKEL